LSDTSSSEASDRNLEAAARRGDTELQMARPDRDVYGMSMQRNADALHIARAREGLTSVGATVECSGALKYLG